MRPMRAGMGQYFSGTTMAAKLAIGLVAGSVIFALGRGAFVELLPLYPALVWSRLYLWQPLTYVFLETQPLGVIFGGLILWSMGNALEVIWGGRRLAAFVIGTTVAAGVLTALLAFVSSSIAQHGFAGGTVMASIVWVAFGLSVGRGQTNFWGIPMSGNGLALIGVGFVALNAVMGSWVSTVPEILALALTYAQMRVTSPRMLYLRLQSWRTQAKLKARARHLRMVTKERNTSGESDRFLH